MAETKQGTRSRQPARSARRPSSPSRSAPSPRRTAAPRGSSRTSARWAPASCSSARTAAGATSSRRPTPIAEAAAEKAGITLHESFDGEFAAKVRTGPYEWTPDGRHPARRPVQRLSNTSPGCHPLGLWKHGPRLGARMIDTPTLVDQYCHGVLRTELGLGTFEAHLGRTAGPPAPGTTFFDTQTGFAVRRWCPPLLGLEPHCPPARYLARRRELGVLEAGRRLLRGSGISTYLVDTGLPGDLTGPARDRRGGRGRGARDRPSRTARRTGRRHLGHGRRASSPTSPRPSTAPPRPPSPSPPSPPCGHGLALAPEPPGPGEVRGAAGRWLAGRQVGGRLTDPVLVRHLLWIAVASGCRSSCTSAWRTRC